MLMPAVVVAVATAAAVLVLVLVFVFVFAAGKRAGGASQFSDGASVHTNPRLAEELAATQYRGSYGVNSVGENVVTEQRLLDIYASQQ